MSDDFFYLFLNILLLDAFAENKCSESGASFRYSESFISKDNNSLRVITTNGCPNHFNNCQRDICSGSSSNAEIRLRDIIIPAVPVFSLENSINVTCLYGPVGVALNGVPIYSQSGKSTCVDAAQQEGTTFDKCAGHEDPETHEYHYHVAPSCLLKQLNYTGSKYHRHSAQVGWALDGFPIYGPTGPFGVPMVRCGDCEAHSKYCLDACNGLYGALNGTDGQDGFLYR